LIAIKYFENIWRFTRLLWINYSLFLKGNVFLSIVVLIQKEEIYEMDIPYQSNFKLDVQEKTAKITKEKQETQEGI